MTIHNIRNHFRDNFLNENFVQVGNSKTIEIIGASFLANEESIFGKPNYEYIGRELDWYETLSRNVNDIAGEVPKIWKTVSSREGEINSNYGYLIFSAENKEQYEKVLKTLQADPTSRRAVMIYTNPNMHEQWNRKGMTDFVCTNTVQYVIRDKKVHAIVQMRSNDAWAGYRNDYAWQKYVLEILARDLNIPSGDIHWNVGSLHIYSPQFYLLDHYVKTAEINITKKEYDLLYK